MKNLEQYFLPIWALIFGSGIIIACQNITSKFFMICVQFYLILFGLVNILYAFASRNKAAKKEHIEFFNNEIITGILFLCMSTYYPFVFQGIPAEIQSQFYFHLWDSLTVHLLCWKIYLYFSKKKNNKKERGFPYTVWKEIILGMHNGEKDSEQDFKRKMMHFLTSAGVIGVYFLSISLESWFFTIGLTGLYIAKYCWVVFSIHLIWIMNIQDLIRLTQFERLGRFATRWLENSIRPKEINTFTSAAIMLLSWIPFILGPIHLIIVVSLIGANSDAMASIIGKKFGKHFIRSTKKTYAGLFAGGFTTLLIINFVHFVLPFPTFSLVQVQLVAMITAIAFMLIDYFGKNISDNFLNPIICGGVLWIFMLIF